MLLQRQKLAIVVIAIALIAVLLALSMRPVPMGPSKILLDGKNQLRVLAAGTLYTLDAEGTLLSRQPLPEDLQIAGASDFALLADGQVLLADANQHDIFRCDPSLQHCESLYLKQGQGGGSLSNSLKLAVDETAGILWVADTSNHRLLQLLLNGQHLQTFGGDRFIYPNQIGFSRTGDLVVADTNHHLLRGFDPKGDLQTARWEIFVPLHRGGRIGHNWPNAWAEVGEDWWVVAEDGAMKHGDVLRFNREGKPLTRVLPQAVDPLSIAVVGRQVLVADAERVVIWRAGFDGSDGGQFGDVAFQQALRHVQQQRQQQKLFLRLLPVLIAVVALIAALLLKRLGENISTPEEPWPQWQHDATQRMPHALAADEQLWIDAYPQQLARFHRQRWMLWAVLLVTVIALIYIEFLLTQRLGVLTLKSQKAPLFYLISGLLVSLQLHYQQRSQGASIGIENGALLVRDVQGRISRHLVDGVRYSNLALLAGHHLIPLQTPWHGAIYPPEQIRDVLLSRLPKQHFQGTFRLSLQMWRTGHPVAICIGLWGVVIVLLYLS